MEIEFSEAAILGAVAIVFLAAFLYRRRKANSRMAELSTAAGRESCLVCGHQDDEQGIKETPGCPECGFDRSRARADEERADCVEFLERLNTHRDSLAAAKRIVGDPFKLLTGILMPSGRSLGGQATDDLSDASRMQLDAIAQIKELADEFPDIAALEVAEADETVGDILYGSLGTPGEVSGVEKQMWKADSGLTDRGILGRLSRRSELKSELSSIDAVCNAIGDRLRP